VLRRLRRKNGSQFRGPNGAGISNSTNLPVEFGPEKNLVWKADLPGGHSSPVFGFERIFVTAIQGKELFTIGLSIETANWMQRNGVFTAQ